MRPIILSAALALAFIISIPGQGGTAGFENGVSPQLTVYLISRGYHTGILIPSAPASKTIRVLHNRAEGYAEFGWGEAHYYQTENPGCLDAPGALFLPNKSVVRLEFLPEGPGYSLSRSSFAIKFILSEKQFLDMCGFIESSFSKFKNEPVSESSERNSTVIYYTSMLKYHLFNTCNTWAAEALEAGGTGISPSGVIFAHQLRRRAEKKGCIIKK